MPSSFHLNNGRVCVYIGPYKPSRFKNNTFISNYLTIFYNHVCSIQFLHVYTLILSYILYHISSIPHRGSWKQQSHEERASTITQEENITFGQLATFLHNMMELGLPRETTIAFLDKQSIIGNLSPGNCLVNLRIYFQHSE